MAQGSREIVYIANGSFFFLRSADRRGILNGVGSMEDASVEVNVICPI